MTRDELAAARETLKELYQVLWDATIEHHYGGSTGRPHRSVMPGGDIRTCTEGYCPAWNALSLRLPGIFDQLLADAELGREWRLTEAALPAEPGDRLWRFGPWRLRVVGPWPIRHFEDSPVTWQAIAEPYNAGQSNNPLDADIEALGRTPAEALAALREKLDVTG
jgi:hypothetical protein